jgi:hypothetical protein
LPKKKNLIIFIKRRVVDEEHIAKEESGTIGTQEDIGTILLKKKVEPHW